MDNNTPSVILELAGKFAAEVLDYVVDLSVYLAPTAALENVSVTIEASGNGESPPEMTVSEVSAVPLVSGPAQAVMFWLHGGTSGVRYRGVIEFGDDGATGSPAVTRLRRRFFYVVVS